MSFPLDLIGELFGGRLVAERAELDSPTGGQTTLIYLDNFNLDRRYAVPSIYSSARPELD